MSQKPDDRLWFLEEWIGYLYLDFVEYCDGARPSVSRSRFSVQLPGWFTARRLRFRFVPAPRHPAPPRPPEPRLPLETARRGSRKIWYRARSMAARKGLLRPATSAGSECRRRRMRRGRSVTAARARCASACPEPHSEYDWSASLARSPACVAGAFSAVLPSAQDRAHKGAARTGGAEPPLGAGQPACHDGNLSDAGECFCSERIGLAWWPSAVCLRARLERRARITGSTPSLRPGPAWIADSEPTSDPRGMSGRRGGARTIEEPDHRVRSLRRLRSPLNSLLWQYCSTQT